MFEIKINRKKTIWPFFLISLIITTLVTYLLNNRKKVGLVEKPESLNELKTKQSQAIMARINNELFFLNDLDKYQVADNYPDVRGWAVRDAENYIIGKVDDLLVNTLNKKAVYLDIEVDASVIEEGDTQSLFHVGTKATESQNREGDDHLFIPVEWVNPNAESQILITNHIDYQSFVNARRFSRNARTLPEFVIDQFRITSQENTFSYD